MWPHTARFCGQCGRSFGVRLCAKGHASPPYANACTACGSTELSVAVRYRSFRIVTLALSALLALVAMKAAVANIGLIASLTLGLCDVVATFVIGASLTDVAFSLLHLALLSALPFFLAWVFFERCRLPSKSFRLYANVASAVVRLGIGSAALVGRLLFSPGKGKDKKREEGARGKTSVRGFDDSEGDER
jgi:hypothetical protein